MNFKFAIAILLSGLALGPAIAAQATGLLNPTSNTTGLFHLDSGTGSIILDSGPKKINGTMTSGASWQLAPWGQALQFDGLTGQVDIPDPQLKLLPAKSAFTIEAWVKLGKIGGFAPQPIISRAATNTQAAMELRYMPFPAGWAFKFQNPLGLTMSIYNRFDVQPNTWYHLALTWDGYTGRLYCNGRLLSSLTFTDYMPLDPAQPWHIGAGENGNFLNGTVDEVHFANDALDPANLRTLYSIYGIGKPGYNNIVPTIHLSGAPPTTNASGLQIEVGNGFPNLPGFLFVSPKPDLIVISGGLILVAAKNMIISPFVLNGGLAGRFGTAKAIFNLPPLSPNFLGSTLCFQALLADPMALSLFSLTPGLITWFPY